MLIEPQSVPVVELADGSSVPSIGMGTFGSDHASPAQVASAVAVALRIGYRMFDCASVYRNEAQIGEVLVAATRSGMVSREELYVTSKVWNDMHGKGDVLLSMAQTLKDLQLDYIDCYFVHWPFPNYHPPGCGADSRSPDALPFSVERYMAAWRQMERLVDMGLARHIGMSNMTIPKLEAVLPHCRIRPALLEMELHPAFQQPVLFDYCLSHNIRPVAYSPLGSPGRPERDRMAEDVAATELPAVLEVARAHGIHPALVCLKWSFQMGAISIPFSVNEKNQRANLACVDEDPLTKAEMALLKGADRNCRLIKGHVFLWEGAKDWRDLWDEDGEIAR